MRCVYDDVRTMVIFNPVATANEAVTNAPYKAVEMIDYSIMQFIQAYTWHQVEESIKLGDMNPFFQLANSGAQQHWAAPLNVSINESMNRGNVWTPIPGQRRLR